jgi:hypothetical protein
MPGFKVPCPSCEAPVLIKDPKLVGTKVECPKCKSRFKVEEPAAAAAGADAKAAKKDAKGEKKAAATPGKNKKLIKIGAGVGAVVLLIVVGVVAFGGGDDKKKNTGGGGFAGTKGGAGGTDATNPDGQNPEGKTDPKANPDAPQTASSVRNATNLLPGQAVAVYRLNFDRLRESSLYEAFTGSQVEGPFEESMGFPLSDVDTYVHCFTGEQRLPFGVIKLKTPAPPAEAARRMLKTNTLNDKPKAVKSYSLYAIRSNPFVSAVSNALSMRSVLGEFYDRLPAAPKPADSGRPMGVCFYDNQHVLLGDYATLEKFLGELGADGYPPFQTVMASAGARPTAPGAKGPAPGEKPVTSLDTYRTVEFPLKKALDEMGGNRLVVPMLLYAEKFDARQYDPKLLRKELDGFSAALEPLAERTRYLGANLIAFTPRQLVANLRLTLRSEGDSRELAKERLAPDLAFVADKLKLLLTSPVQFNDYTQGGSTTAPNTGIPQYPGMGYPGMGPEGTGLPNGVPPGKGIAPTMPPGMSNPGGISPPMPPSPGGVGAPTTAPGELSPGGKPAGPPGFPPGFRPGGSPGMPGFTPPNFPGTTAPGGYPGMGYPGMEPGGAGQPKGKEPAQTHSHIDLGMIDNQLQIAVDLNWSDLAYRTFVAPRMVSIANQVKGKMAIFSSDFSWHALAAAGPKYAADHKAFPRGTVDRGSNVNRYGLPYPPAQRVSFFYELLPYLGRGALKDSLHPKLAWYDEKNLPAPGQDRAGAWVPELLVPYYPQTAWRATSPLAPDHVLGATNYVAVAGVGLDVARASPASPEFKKLVGITGYDWGSKLEEITDGPATTIYLLQTPPALQQPWIAGGGATVRGLDPNDPLAGFKYHHPDGKGGTKEGTYALMADGAVRWIAANIDPKALRAMATRAGGDNADIGDIEKVAPKVEIPKFEKATELKSEPKPPAEKKPEAKKADDKKADGKGARPEEKTPEPKAGNKKETAPAPKEKK